MQFVAHIASNQQWDEGADLGVVERGCHPVKALVHVTLVEPAGKLLLHLLSDVL